MSEEQIKVVVDRALAAYQDSVRKRNRWVLSLLMGGILTILGACVTGIVVIIQNDTRLSIHTQDGHPESVRTLIKQRDDELHRHEVLMTEIKTKQDYLISGQEIMVRSLDEVKKKLGNP